jgi:hypothetical protein
MVIQHKSEHIIVPSEHTVCIVCLKYRITFHEESGSIKQYRSAQGYTAWSPSSFSDKVANTFYHQVIKHEKFNAS